MVTILYAATIFLSSALLFLIQPMVVQAILPWFGGTAGVWTASMLFFQFLLLAGYAYSYLVTHYLSSRPRAVLHIALLIASATMLPVAVPQVWKVSDYPAWSILTLLGSLLGLPYFVLSTTGPLIQFWFAQRPGGQASYRLFALSNAASLVALLAYPFLIQPRFSTRSQLTAWSIAYVVFLLLVGLSALRGGSTSQVERESSEALGGSRPMLWAVLAACPCMLWLAVANHLSQEVAAVPFLWVGLLGLYLLSLILCFDRDGWYRPQLYRWLLPVACAAMGFRLARPGPGAGFHWDLLLFSAALLVCCMFLHGELARLKPAPGRAQTYYYLTMATGGLLGSAFVAVAAPSLLNSYLELPIAIAICLLLALRFLFRYPLRRLLRVALFASLAFVLAGWVRSGADVEESRNFYGALRVVDSGEGPGRIRTLYHGVIRHGVELLSPDGGKQATAYFGPLSGIGLTMSKKESGRKVGVIGLGAGTLAAYGMPGDTFRFYEIDPAIIRVASTHFRFLKESAAKVEVVEGDGRKALEQEPPASFSILVLDAFSGDSVPVHLLTKEAFELYFRQLKAGGTLAVNVTNRNLDVGAVVRAASFDLRKRVFAVHSEADDERHFEAADWMLVSDGPGDGGEAPPSIRAWTDDYNSLLHILKR
jgi:hypothetical protein